MPSTRRALTTQDIFGHIFEFSLDQHGSRFIQQKLEVVGLDELKVAFDEVQPRILALMTDVFGNYVVQKFLDHGSEQHRLKLAGHLKGNVLSLSLQMYGCRVIQKALEVRQSGGVRSGERRRHCCSEAWHTAVLCVSLCPRASKACGECVG